MMNTTPRGDYLEQRMSAKDYWESLCYYTTKHRGLQLSFGHSMYSEGYVCDNVEDLKAAIRQKIYDERGEA